MAYHCDLKELVGLYTSYVAIIMCFTYAHPHFCYIITQPVPHTPIIMCIGCHLPPSVIICVNLPAWLKRPVSGQSNAQKSTRTGEEEH